MEKQQSICSVLKCDGKIEQSISSDGKTVSRALAVLKCDGKTAEH